MWWWAAGVAVAMASRVTAAPQAVQGFEVRDVVTGVSKPTAIAFAPGGLLLVAEKGGQLRLWSRRGGLRPTPVIQLSTCTQSEMGLLGIAVDPEFAANGYLYLYHTQPPGGDASRCGTAEGRTNRVVRVTMHGETAADLVVLLDGIRTDNGNHDGGGLRIGADGFLYVGAGDTGRGDFGNPGESTNPYAQDRQSLNGKLLRLARDGSPAAGNPYLNEPGNARFVFAYGLRNPFRFGIEPDTGLVWLGDVGQNSFEEIDVVRGGENFGWPQCEGFQPAAVCPGNTTPPAYVYPQSADGSSITGGVFYDDTLFGAGYRGNYFFGDYIFDRIWRGIPRHDPDGFVGEPEVFVRDAGSPVDFALAPDGSLYYAAYTANAVRRILPQAGTSKDCARALGGPTPAWARQADAVAQRCGRGEIVMCFPPVGYRASFSKLVQRRIERRCGSTPPPELCGRLSCAPCADTVDLIRCVGDLVTDYVFRTEGAAFDADDGRCGRTVARVTARAAAARLAAYQRCRVQGRETCAPPSVGPALARKVARACNDPSEAVCSAVGCAACGNGAALADCVGVSVANAVGGLAFNLDGH